jgi:peptidoglycan/LPS O-acetylase OafA/YrhL
MLAMYVIVLFHTHVPWLEGGFIAVNLFFVLSGYLVTNVILSEMDRTGTLRLGNFYARRVRRLLPAAVVAIVGTSLLFVLIAPVVRRVAIIGDAQSALLYVANWRFIQQANDYFATDVDKSPFLHFWTLSIEEQFYVVFPLLLLLLSKVGRRWVMLATLGLICVGSVAAQLFWAHADPMHAYYGTDARAYQLAAGAVLALAMRQWPVRVRPWVASTIATVGMAGFVVLCLNVPEMSRSGRGVAGTLACVLLISGLMLAENQPLGRLLSTRSVVYLGTISYATYLWHWPAVLALEEVLDVGPVVMAVLAGVIATAMAAVSAELLELPVRKAKVLDRFRWRTALVGVTTSALVAATVVPWVLERDRPPALVTASKSVPADNPADSPAARAVVPKDKRREALPQDVDWKRIDRDKGPEYTCTASNPDDCTIVRGGGPHILVIGDSHARMMAKMFTDLAKEHHFTLSMNDVAGCAWQENLHNVQSPEDRQRKCTAARVGWYDEVLPKLDPDLVVLTSYPRDDSHWESRLKERDGRKEPLHRMIQRATVDTLRKIDKVASRTLMIETVITPEKFQPNDCLTTTDDPRKCAVPVPETNRPTDGFYLAAAAQDPDLYTVNLNPAFCPDAPVCMPVVNGQIVYRDRHHLTPEFADHQRDKVWRLVEKTGVLDDFTVS